MFQNVLSYFSILWATDKLVESSFEYLPCRRRGQFSVGKQSGSLSCHKCDLSCLLEDILVASSGSPGAWCWGQACLWIKLHQTSWLWVCLSLHVMLRVETQGQSQFNLIKEVRPWKDYPACDAQPLRAAWLPALHKVTWWTFPLKERGRQLNIQRSLFANVLSKRLAEARSQGFSPGLPLFGLSPLPPRKHVSRKLEPGAKGGRSTQHTDMGCWCVNCWAACLSGFSFGSENLPYTFYIFLFLACSLRNVNDSMAISIFFSEKQDEM